MVDRHGTFTRAEHVVFEMLRRGPALLGPRTEALERPGFPEPPRFVEIHTARRLARLGLVTIDAGAQVTLSPLGRSVVEDDQDAGR